MGRVGGIGVLISARLRAIDPGRLIAAPVFLLLALPAVARLMTMLEQFPAGGLPAAGRLLNQLLAVCFSLLVIVLYFLRSAPTARAKSMPANVLAIAGTFLPLIFVLLPNPPRLIPALLIASNIVIVVGMIFACYALATLGRSFSITPGSRRLVQSGPYRLVRHPLYVGEFVICFGVVLAAPTAIKLAVLVLHCCIQIYRALREEELLAASFPEYAGYARRTPRFVPIPVRAPAVEPSADRASITATAGV